MKERNIKLIIVFLVICVIYAGIVIIINRNRKEKLDDSIVLLFSKNDIVEYQNGELIRTNKINNDLKYTVYIDNNYFGEYSIKYENEFSLYKDNDNISYDGSFFAYTNNINVNQKKLIIDEINDNDLLSINKLIGSNTKINDLIVNEKIIVDLDNNGVNDQIINVSNLDWEIEQDIYFNLVYLVLNNQTEQVLIRDIVDAKDVLVEPVYLVFNIFNINGSKYDNIVIQKKYFSLGGDPNVMIFGNSNNNYLKIIN